jgi:Ca2+-binding RTX toxin-like protein
MANFQVRGGGQLPGFYGAGTDWTVKSMTASNLVVEASWYSSGRYDYALDFGGNISGTPRYDLTGEATTFNFWQNGQLVVSATGLHIPAAIVDPIFEAWRGLIPLYQLMLSGKDVVTGTSGGQVMYGGGGADRLDGGTGADTMFGGAGNDTYVVDNKADLTSEAWTMGQPGGGLDTILASVSYVIGFSEVENLVLQGTATNGTGNDYANTITGNGLDNLLVGGVGSDTLAGGLGNDTLVGGNDRDRMTGGGGNDVFRFDKQWETPMDTIVDFRRGQDRIDLSPIFGDQPLTFVGTKSFTSYGQVRVQYNEANNRLVVSVNLNSDLSQAEMEIALPGVSRLLATDFVL